MSSVHYLTLGTVISIIGTVKTIVSFKVDVHKNVIFVSDGIHYIDSNCAGRKDSV